MKSGVAFVWPEGKNLDGSTRMIGLLRKSLPQGTELIEQKALQEIAFNIIADCECDVDAEYDERGKLVGTATYNVPFNYIDELCKLAGLGGVEGAERFLETE